MGSKWNLNLFQICICSVLLFSLISILETDAAAENKNLHVNFEAGPTIWDAYNRERSHRDKRSPSHQDSKESAKEALHNVKENYKHEGKAVPHELKKEIDEQNRGDGHKGEENALKHLQDTYKHEGKAVPHEVKKEIKDVAKHEDVLEHIVDKYKSEHKPVPHEVKKEIKKEGGLHHEKDSNEKIVKDLERTFKKEQKAVPKEIKDESKEEHGVLGSTVIKDRKKGRKGKKNKRRNR